MAKEKILVVDDEYLIRWSLSEGLKDEGWKCTTAENGEEALEVFRKISPDMVLLDIKLPGISGIDVLEKIKELDPDVPVMMITATSQVEIAVKAMKLGAYDYISKPFNFDDVRSRVVHALENRNLKDEIEYLRNKQASGHGFDRIIGESPKMMELVSMAMKIARSASTTVLLQGDSGTGKDLMAQAIHYESDRANKPFMPINCTALPDELLESELMGHERGAFTDAKKTKKGLFELADGGTIYLDEIGDMKLSLQAKILRFIEERSFKRVGGKDDIEVDVRIIAATNRDLESAIAERAFREDLYYRLSVIPLTLPPLKERPEDIPLLADHLLGNFNREFKSKFKGFSEEAVSLLKSHAWPGNVRELRNVVERAMILSSDDVIGPSALPWPTVNGVSEGSSATGGLSLPDGGVNLEEVEREFLLQALEKTDNNQTKAAQMLGLSRDALRYRMKKFELI